MIQSAKNPRNSAAIFSGIRAVAFDGYGTLFDFTEPDFIATMAEIAGQQSLDADAGEMWQRFLKASKHLRVEHHHDPVYIRYHEAWRLQFERVFRQMRLDGSALAAADHFWKRLAEAPAFEESAPVIEALRSKGYEVALLSNADDDFLTECLRRNRLEFEVIITSESAQAIKPNREIFDKLAVALKTPPGEILYAGDNPIPDVLGPVRAGMLAAWVNRGGYRKPRNVPQPHVRVKTLAELAGLLNGAEDVMAPAPRPTPKKKIGLGDTPRPPAEAGSAPSALPRSKQSSRRRGVGVDVGMSTEAGKPRLRGESGVLGEGDVARIEQDRTESGDRQRDVVSAEAFQPRLGEDKRSQVASLE
jgi:2-haloacid dehalogenase